MQSRPALQRQLPVEAGGVGGVASMTVTTRKLKCISHVYVSRLSALAMSTNLPKCHVIKLAATDCIVTFDIIMGKNLMS